jgi:acyl-coenzyme A thioesterase PaaI-like protein
MSNFNADEQVGYLQAVSAVTLAGVASTYVIQTDNSGVSQNMAINFLDEMKKSGLIGEAQENGTHIIL